METLFNSGRRHFTLLLAAAMLFVAAFSGCQSTEPHVTAKVIFQDDGHVAGELMSEWH